jgi:hypothetical protein
MDNDGVKCHDLTDIDTISRTDTSSELVQFSTVLAKPIVAEQSIAKLCLLARLAQLNSACWRGSPS